jgi:hypothetical protein
MRLFPLAPHVDSQASRCDLYPEAFGIHRSGVATRSGGTPKVQIDKLFLTPFILVESQASATDQ